MEKNSITRIVTLLKENVKKELNCQICEKKFKTKKTLKTHYHAVHDNSAKIHNCNILTVHKGHKDYKCESCVKSFTTAQYLKKHIHTIHEGYKDYNCDSCGKSFSHATTLRKHIHTIHEGNKDHKCESCGKFEDSHSYNS